MAARLKAAPEAPARAAAVARQAALQVAVAAQQAALRVAVAALREQPQADRQPVEPPAVAERRRPAGRLVAVAQLPQADRQPAEPRVVAESADRRLVERADRPVLKLLFVLSWHGPAPAAFRSFARPTRSVAQVG